MRIRPLRPTALVALALAAAACVPVTVNINFPQEKLEGAAGRIEDMVRSPDNPPREAPRRKGPEGGLADRLLAGLGPREAAAQARSVDVVPEIRTQTPELMRAIASRKERFPQLQEWKRRGCIGETNRGFVEARPGPGCGPEVARLVDAENADRRYIYETLMSQNRIPASDAARVQAAFAKANRDRAEPGEWIQLPDGRWTRK
jgi:uncharacterized protein YdbL (DUF1318 family)